jgi:hypothetical protein
LLYVGAQAGQGWSPEKPVGGFFGFNPGGFFGFFVLGFFGFYGFYGFFIKFDAYFVKNTVN